jgi:phosphatidylserine synthase
MARRRRVRSANAISPRPFIGMSLMAAALFLYGYSAVVVPWYVFVGLLLVWAFLLLVSLAWWSLHPERLPWVAALAWVIWFAVLLGGGLAFDWTP